MRTHRLKFNVKFVDEVDLLCAWEEAETFSECYAVCKVYQKTFPEICRLTQQRLGEHHEQTLKADKMLASAIEIAKYLETFDSGLLQPPNP